MNDSYEPKAKDPAGDPLAELARLIGQNDPFAETKPKLAARPDDRPAPEWLSRPAAAFDRDEDAYAPPQAAREHYGAEQYEAPYEPAPYPQTTYQQPAAAADEPAHGHAGATHHAEQSVQAARYADPRYEQDPRYDATETQPAYRAHDDADAGGEPDYQGDDRYRVVRPTPGEYDPDTYYAEDGHMPPQLSEEGTSNRRRGAILTVAAVLGLAVIGTAGAFGYRAFTAGSGAPANPPVIQADATPAKIVPPTANAGAVDAQGKPFQDRIGAPGAPERVVSREEQPVSLPTPPRQLAAGQSTVGQAAAAPLVPPQPQVALTAPEPKRVKTITIRDPSDPMAAAPASTASTRGVAPPAAQKQPGASGPMPIAPQSEPQTRTRTASRSGPAGAGAYAVQVTAQRTEADAQSHYRSLQQKYPAVLGNREPNIRRVTLGASGVFYRAQVEAFATSEQATAFCNNLKAAGGDCIVQRN